MLQVVWEIIIRTTHAKRLSLAWGRRTIRAKHQSPGWNRRMFTPVATTCWRWRFPVPFDQPLTLFIFQHANGKCYGVSCTKRSFGVAARCFVITFFCIYFACFFTFFQTIAGDCIVFFDHMFCGYIRNKVVDILWISLYNLWITLAWLSRKA